MGAVAVSSTASLLTRTSMKAIPQLSTAKLAWELGPLLDCTGSRTEKQSVWIRQQNEALREFCGRWSHVPQFAGFEAWLGGRLAEK